MLDLLAIIFYMSCFIRILNCSDEFETNKWIKKKKKMKNENTCKMKFAEDLIVTHLKNV